MSSKYILAIETSCDETAVAVLRSDDASLEVLSNRISSQVALHAQWGGVVPNLAAREHVQNIPIVLSDALSEAGINLEQIDLISVTNGPGLIPALMVGVNFAKTLAYLLEKPLIGIHHIEGHIYANFLVSRQIQNKEDSPLLDYTKSEGIFPALALVVSGGHTQLVLMEDHLKYEIIGQTLDDAVGEAFDKVARILDIGYPGGPAVAQHATKFQETRNKKQEIFNNQNSITKNNSDYGLRITDYGISFPRPMIHRKNFDFSFSGLKTAVLYETKKNPDLIKNKDYIAEICHEFQQAVVDVLVSKTIKAAEQFNPKTILLAGGVSANTELRKRLGEAISKNLPLTNYRLPEISLTGDNAVMIGVAAYFRWQKMTAEEKEESLNGWKTLPAEANLKLN